MVCAVDDKRFPPSQGDRRGAQFTIAVVHAVIDHTLFFRLNQNVGVSSFLRPPAPLTGQNPLRTQCGRAADAQRGSSA
jgi:hypothetical protein